MTAVLLNILLMSISGYALFRGWSRGGAGAVAALIAWCIGVIAMLVGGGELAQYLLDEGIASRFEEEDLAAGYLAATAIYCVTTLLAGLATAPLASVMSVFGQGVVSSMAGAVITLLRWLTPVSLLLNLWGACSPYCEAVRLADAGDGGIVEGVMNIAPPLSGLPDFSEFVHRRQLKEARYISLNSSRPGGVLFFENHGGYCPGINYRLIYA